MLSLRACIAIVLLAILSMYLAERVGFAIAHSSSLLSLAVALSPGILVTIFGWQGDDWFLDVLAVGLNFLYYSGIAMLVRRYLFSPKSPR